MEMLKCVCLFLLVAISESTDVYVQQGEAYRLDLGVTAKVLAVEVEPSGTEYTIGNFQFEIATEKKPHEVAAVCSGRETGTLRGNKTYNCDPPIVGRFVTLRSPGAENLYFKQMLVQGEAVQDNPTPDAGKEAMKECTSHNTRHWGLYWGVAVVTLRAEDCAALCRVTPKCAGSSYIYGLCYPHFGINKGLIHNAFGWVLYRKQCRDDYSKQCTLPGHELFWDYFNFKSDYVYDADDCAKLCRYDPTCAAASYSEDLLLNIFGVRGRCKRHVGILEQNINYMTLFTGSNSLYIKSCKHDCHRDGAALQGAFGIGRQAGAHSKESCHKSCQNDPGCRASSYHPEFGLLFLSSSMICYHTGLVNYNLIGNNLGSVYLKTCVY